MSHRLVIEFRAPSGEDVTVTVSNDGVNGYDVRPPVRFSVAGMALPVLNRTAKLRVIDDEDDG